MVMVAILLTLVPLLAFAPAARPLSPAHYVATATATVTFSGVVQDATTKAPVAGAKVTIGGVSTTTGTNGQYSVTLAAGKTFHATVVAPGYLGVVLDISAGGALLSGNLHWDFAGAYGLKALGNLTAVLSGVIRDSQTGAAVRGAALAAPGKEVIADSTGHYQITLPGAPRLQLQPTALNYQWRPPLTLSMPNGSTVQGQISFDFSGSAGLQSAFSTGQGDTLARFSQLMPSGSKPLSFQGSAQHDLESSYAVTFPNGDADLGDLTIGSHHFAGKLPWHHGKGVYQLEINASNGFALFNLPVYYGVPYTPPPAPQLYPPEDPSATPAQLAVEALGAFNALRTRYHRPTFVLTPALEQEAQAHSADVVAHNYFDVHPHVGSDGSGPDDRVNHAGVKYTILGEDVADDPSIRGAIDSLMMSPGHRANILLKDFTQVGIGVARQPGGNLILTIDFIQPG
jgi:uncharacterized protein YkwD